MALFLKNNIKKQVFWSLEHVPVVSIDSMTTDLEHWLGTPAISCGFKMLVAGKNLCLNIVDNL